MTPYKTLLVPYKTFFAPWGFGKPHTKAMGRRRYFKFCNLYGGRICCRVFTVLYTHPPLIKNSNFEYLPGETFLFQKACLLLTYLTTNNLRPRFVMSLISKCVIFMKYAKCFIFEILYISTFNNKFIF